jgi:hypothetical protein
MNRQPKHDQRSLEANAVAIVRRSRSGEGRVERSWRREGADEQSMRGPALREIRR